MYGLSYCLPCYPGKNSVHPDTVIVSGEVFMGRLHLFVWAFVLSGFLAACGKQETDASLPLEGEIALSGVFTGVFDLVGTDGNRVSHLQFPGKLMLVYFGFTNCPDICPGDIGVMAAALDGLGEDADSVVPVFISVDPGRDTPGALARYFAFDDRFVPLTGDREAVRHAMASYNVYARRQVLEDSALGYTVDHSRLYYITDRQGRPRTAVNGGVAPGTLTAILRRSIGRF